MKPDYGLMRAKSGAGTAKEFFYGVPLTHLSVGAPGLFTSMLNKVHGGVEYAVSFDLGPKEAMALLAKASPTERKRLEAELRTARPGDTLEFGVPIVVDLETRLGEVQSGAGEQFIPLVVVRVIQDDNDSEAGRPTSRESSKSSGCLLLIGMVTVIGLVGTVFRWWLA